MHCVATPPSTHLDQHVADFLVPLSSCCMKRGASVLALHQKIGVLPINCIFQSWVCQYNKYTPTYYIEAN